MSNKNPTLEDYKGAGVVFNNVNNVLRVTAPDRADEIQKDIDAYNSIIKFMEMFQNDTKVL